MIRRWHRRGLIVPVREVHRLPYFDFQEVATARRLAELLAAGATPQAIEKKLEQLARLVPNVERPLAQLSIIVEGRQLLLRQGEGLIEPGGQMRLDFEAAEHPPTQTPDDSARPPCVISMDQVLSQQETAWSIDEMERAAAELEDSGQILEAIEMYRAALVAGGPSAEICFHLAELLYLTGDVSAARERYSMAVELDEDYVEARANLGCVLAETGEADLALAAFQGRAAFPSGLPGRSLPHGTDTGRPAARSGSGTSLAGVPASGPRQPLGGRSPATSGVGAPIVTPAVRPLRARPLRLSGELPTAEPQSRETAELSLQQQVTRRNPAPRKLDVPNRPIYHELFSNRSCSS